MPVDDLRQYEASLSIEIGLLKAKLEKLEEKRAKVRTRIDELKVEERNYYIIDTHPGALNGC